MATKSVTVREAAGPSDLGAFRALCEEYAASLPFSLCFQGFEAEMASLPGKYGPPEGVILLGEVVARPSPDADATSLVVGAVALRPIPPRPGERARVCEMKRMYVRPIARGLGVGRALGERLLVEGTRRGYDLMRLDTETDFVAATALYRSLGFVECPRYNDDPLENTIWMERRLT
ncbi:MAG: GNAT family N-acetyltransferase [Planctomycetota bacterium]|nr:GNAT family N-acetyltransferase [Planctomycetota bacterium]